MNELKKIHTLIFDFDGVFTDNKVYLDETGKESVRCCRGDGFAFDLLRKFYEISDVRLDVFILSKEKNQVVQKRAEKLKLACLNGVDNKLSVLSEYFSKKRPEDKDPFSGLVFVGNDLNDLAVMKRAKFSFAPADAHLAIQSIATTVLPQLGGNGCVRAVVESLLGIDKMSTIELEEFLA